ncbi:MAG: class I tRNA ligase family protein [Candidatus Yonathbacteria bacterium]|nr:class I tRNA ligase family protein [Candidatus Yonathbacteria bacterium]NTW48068.1 class I tRNA ligase family protein [Candidatus Yonathbacteria bacterium]
MTKSVLSCPVSDGDDMKNAAPSVGREDDTARATSNVARAEEETLATWQNNHIFEKTLEQTADGKEFVFYDGPPFATGLPHYGHLLAGAMKDAIPRYHTMRGEYVRRQWGWDCHGLPVEVLVEKELGLANKKDVETYGIDRFNERARASVMTYDAEWKNIVPRMGRFIDMEHPYKTMDTAYSESVWWAYKTLYDKGLVYKGYRSMHICPRCQTTLSNNEVSEGYKDVKDLSVIAKFELIDEPNTFILAWTTTPWTLPGNVALAVGEDIEYVKIKYDGDTVIEFAGEKREETKRVTLTSGTYILSKEVLRKNLDSNGGIIGMELLFGNLTKLNENLQKYPAHRAFDEFLKEYNIEIIKGEKLVGKSYKPLFPYYASDEKLEHRENGWKIYAGDFVTTDEGTGIVHIAPAFGADDLALAQKYDLPFVQHVGMDGIIKPEVVEFAGKDVSIRVQENEKQPRQIDIDVVRSLEARSLSFKRETGGSYNHSYPHCWRCDTPLLNYATDAWFVNVQKLKVRASEENKSIGWTPDAIGHARFANLLETAPDWNISRQRFWGAPLPVWESADGDRIVIGSLEEMKSLTKRSGNTYAVMRHGEADHNVLGIMSGLPENPHHITEKGKEQARASARRMQEDGFVPDMIVVSPLVRTRETADIVVETLGLSSDVIVIDERIKEYDFGSLEGQPNPPYGSIFADTREWIEKERPGGGESNLIVKKRAGDALYAYEQMHTGKKILFVTHDGTARMLASAAEGLTVDDMVTRFSSPADFLTTGAYKVFSFIPLPHNTEHELDVHRPYIDEIVLEKEGKEYRRVVDVFDCWFESGSMPFAQFGYPARNTELFTKNFPADFIAEGVDQTRGWFYSLLMLGVGLFDHAPYKHVIVNGLILAEDGKKMSKKLKNYPDPMDVVARYGADALRMYLLGSPATRGEELRFSEKGVDEVYKKIIARLENVVSFYTLYASRDTLGQDTSPSTHVLDRWIMARLSEVAREVTEALDAYELDRAIRPFGDFVDDVSTWYVRRSRERIKDESDDARVALMTLRTVLHETAILLAPFAPFLAERVYANVRGEKESVHLETWPLTSPILREAGEQERETNVDIVGDMQRVRDIVSQALEVRKREGIKVRQPLATLYVSSDELFVKNPELAGIVKDELNVKEIIADTEKAEESVAYDMTITLELRREGQMRELLRAVQDARKASGMSPEDRATLSIVETQGIRAIVEEHNETIMKTALLDDITLVLSLEGGASADLGDGVSVVFVVEKKEKSK